ncbi:hypothetical protein D3C72_1504940 [compost metagenome]
MPWRRMASTPNSQPSSAPVSVPAIRPSSGVRPQTLIAWPATYAEPPRKAAWPKDSSPVQPNSRLKAAANSAKHMSFITNTG